MSTGQLDRDYVMAVNSLKAAVDGLHSFIAGDRVDHSPQSALMSIKLVKQAARLAEDRIKAALPSKA